MYRGLPGLNAMGSNQAETDYLTTEGSKRIRGESECKTQMSAKQI
jgi:hypothetical protein